MLLLLLLMDGGNLLEPGLGGCLLEQARLVPLQQQQQPGGAGIVNGRGEVSAAQVP